MQSVSYYHGRPLFFEAQGDKNSVVAGVKSEEAPCRLCGNEDYQGPESLHLDMTGGYYLN